MDFNKLSKTKFNNSIYANTIILGVGSKEYQEIFNKNLMVDLLQEFFGESKENVEAFELGYNLINP